MNRLEVSVMQGLNRFNGRRGVRLALLAGMLLAGAGAASADVLATWLGFDTTTKGNWHDGTGNDLVYGQDGYWLIYNGGVGWKSTPFPPSYATVGDPVTDASAYSTTASSTAAKHLLIPGSSAHEDGIWYCGGSSFTFDVAITDANTHRLAIYCWAYEGGGVQIEALDAGNGDAVLDTRSPSNGDYANGVYFVWNIKGHLKFRVTGVGARPFASGLFFGAPSTPWPVENRTVTQRGTDSATLPGRVNVDLGASDKTEVWWGQVSGTWTASNVWAGPVTSPSNFTHTATGLDINTTYYFTYAIVTSGPVRVWAQTTNSFKTLPPPADYVWDDGAGGNDHYWMTLANWNPNVPDAVCFASGSGNTFTIGSGGTAYCEADTTFGAPLTVNIGATLMVTGWKSGESYDRHATASDLRLNGGTVKLAAAGAYLQGACQVIADSFIDNPSPDYWRNLRINSTLSGTGGLLLSTTTNVGGQYSIISMGGSNTAYSGLIVVTNGGVATANAYPASYEPGNPVPLGRGLTTVCGGSTLDFISGGDFSNLTFKSGSVLGLSGGDSIPATVTLSNNVHVGEADVPGWTTIMTLWYGPLAGQIQLDGDVSLENWSNPLEYSRASTVSANLIGTHTLRVLFGRTATTLDHSITLSGDNSGLTGKVLVDAMNSYSSLGLRLNSVKALGDKTCTLEITGNGGKVEYLLAALTNVNVLGLKLGATTIPGSFHGTAYDITATDPGTGVNFANYFTGAAGETITVFDMRLRGTVITIR